MKLSVGLRAGIGFFRVSGCYFVNFALKKTGISSSARAIK
jgi:hypothetical protein